MSADSQADTAVLTGQAWTDFCRALEAAGKVVLEGPDTVLDRAEGIRYLARLTRNSLYATFENSDPDRPRWQGLDLVKIGADNPDNIYHSAPVRGTNTYRITGQRGTIALTVEARSCNRAGRFSIGKKPMMRFSAR